MQERGNRLDDIKRNLQDEFNQLGSPAVETTSAAPAVPMPTQAPPLPTLPVADSNGSSSSRTNSPMLSSISQPWPGGCSGGVTSTPAAGWPEARPMQPSLNMIQLPH